MTTAVHEQTERGKQGEDQNALGNDESRGHDAGDALWPGIPADLGVRRLRDDGPVLGGPAVLDRMGCAQRRRPAGPPGPTRLADYPQDALRPRRGYQGAVRSDALC